MIWLIFALLIALGLLVLFSGRGSADTAVDPVAHYKAQLAEIDADEARGMIDSESAQAARLEVQRRLLRANADAENPISDSETVSALESASKSESALKNNSFPPAVYAGAALTLIVFAGGFYSLLGSPGTPAAPPPQRQTAENQLLEEGGITMGQAAEQVKAHLAENPRDMQGWLVLAKTASSIGDYPAAVSAYSALADMNPGEPNYRIEEFEAYMAHAGGQITPAARLVLAALLDTSPDHPAGQYYLGLAHLQTGNESAARAVWTALADRSTADAPWMPTLTRQLQGLGVRPPGLSDEDIAVVNNMSDSEREAFLNSMLVRLQSKLDSDPTDTTGWLMLARSKLTMGDKKGAIDTLKSGISANPGDKSAELQAFLDNVEMNLNP